MPFKRHWFSSANDERSVFRYNHSSKIIVDQLKTCKKEAGDLIIPMKEGIWSFENVHGELGMIVDGTIARESESEITLFKSVGNAIQDLAMINLIMKKLA